MRTHLIPTVWRKHGLSFVWVAILGALLWSYMAIAQPQTNPRVVWNIFYFENSQDPGQTLDLYLPVRSKVGSKIPLLVWVHGGGWRVGSKKDEPGAKYLVDSGYAMASVNYRLTDKAIFPAQLQDCKAAIRWLRKHADQYGLDPDRIGVFGASAGGHLVAMLGTTGNTRQYDLVGGNTDMSSKVEAVCDISGPTDLTTMAEQGGPQYRLGALVKQFLGADPKLARKIALEASPVSYVQAGDPPFLIVHGDIDDVVPYRQGAELYAALKNAQVDAQLSTKKGVGHNCMSGSTLIESKNFFDKKLRAQGAKG